MKDLGLRPATPGDRDFLWRLHCAAHGPYLAEGLGWDEARQGQEFERRLDLASTQILTLAGADVGMVSAVRGPRGILLRHIAVLPEQQRRGIGTVVLRQLLRRADRVGLPVRLAVLKCNPAGRLYERLGFQTVREAPAFRFMLRPVGGGERKPGCAWQTGPGEARQ